jgi:hypothetical protein
MREPLAVWDTRTATWFTWAFSERTHWATEHLQRARDTYRAEFYLMDAPFAVLYRYARNSDGKLYEDPDTGHLVSETPVTQMLDELPPKRLLDETPEP